MSEVLAAPRISETAWTEASRRDWTGWSGSASRAFLPEPSSGLLGSWMRRRNRLHPEAMPKLSKGAAHRQREPS
jgi:hypothetical protein